MSDAAISHERSGMGLGIDGSFCCAGWIADDTIFDFFFSLSTHSMPVKRFSRSLPTLYNSDVCSMTCMTASIVGLMDGGITILMPR